MRLLLDTQLLIWTVAGSLRVSARALTLIDDPANPVLFSAVSMAEIAIKRSLERPDFLYEPSELRRRMLAADFEELPLTGEHAVALRDLPWVHKDPFDRLLVAQAGVEGLTLLTTDRLLSRYPGDVRRV